MSKLQYSAFMLLLYTFEQFQQIFFQDLRIFKSFILHVHYRLLFNPKSHLNQMIPILMIIQKMISSNKIALILFKTAIFQHIAWQGPQL